jgi:hypothetical protein
VEQSIEQHERKLDEQRRASITMIDGAWEDEEEGERDLEERESGDRTERGVAATEKENGKGTGRA